MTPVSAPQTQMKQVEAVHKVLEHVSGTTHQPCYLLAPDGKKIALPASVFSVVDRVVSLLARGDAVSVVPVGKEITTQQAANLLNISRQYLVRLLERDEIRYRSTGKHRRLLIKDVLAYRDRRDRERRQNLRDLSQMTRAMGGYEKELRPKGRN